MSLLSKLLYFLDRRDKIRAAGLLCMMLFAALLEALGIGLIMPFIALINDPSVVSRNAILSRLYSAVSADSPQQFLVWCSVGLLGFYILKNVYLALVFRVQYRFVFGKCLALSKRLLTAYVSSPYTSHLKRNSSELTRNLTSEVLWIFLHVLIPLFTIIIELMVVAAIMTLLFVMAPGATLAAIGVLGGASVVLYRLIRQRAGDLGQAQQKALGCMIKDVNQALGGIKEAKVLNCEQYFVDAYFRDSRSYSQAQASLKTINELPRLVNESLAMGGLMIVTTVLLLVRGQEMQEVLPLLALFAIAAMRLMPSVNRIVGSFTAIRTFTPSVNVVYRDLLEIEENQATHATARSNTKDIPAISFSSRIEIKDLWYRYPETEEDVLKGVSIVIPRGHAVALVGSSGAGKSTLVDILLGLLTSTRGEVLVDNVEIGSNLPAWQQNIGYIPQTIFLCDDTIRRNVAFGVNDSFISDEQVWAALRAAQLEGFVAALPDQLDTMVGEHGVRLSGGQRQRIGIARAFYRDPEVLVMDEATSALDNETEKQITEAITRFSGVKTIIIIAHRLTTVQGCDSLFFMKDGRIEDSGSYSELLENSHEFQAMAHATRLENIESTSNIR